jgi:hypothetical protein
MLSLHDLRTAEYEGVVIVCHYTVMYVHVRMYVCMYLFIFMCVYVCMYVCMVARRPVATWRREKDDCTVAFARQRLINNRGMMFPARSAKQELNSNRAKAFSVWSVPRCYK